jgi:hypothetical protein
LILLFLGLSYLDTIRHEFEAVRRVAPETAVKRLAARSGQWLQNTAQAIAFFFKTLVGLMPKAVDDIRSMERARFAKYLKPAAIALFAGLIIAPLWSARIIEEEIQSVKDGDADTKWTLTQFPLVSVALRFGSPRYLCNLVQLSSTSSHFVFLDFAGETRHSHLIPIANVADLSHQDKRVVTPDERCPADTTGLPPTGGQEPHMKAIGMRLYEIRRELAALDGPLKSIATESAGWDRPTGSQLVELQDALEQIAEAISDISVQVDLTPLSEKIDRIAMELGGLHKTIRDWDKPTGPQLTALDQNVGEIAAGLDTFMEHGTIKAMLAILTNLENRLGEIKDAVVVCEGERCPERPNLLKAILDIEETLGDLISAATQFPKAVEKNFAEVKEEIGKTLIHHGSLPNGCKLLVDEKTERKLFVHFRRDSSEPFPDPDYGSGEEGSADIAGQNRAIIDLIVKNLTERLKHTPQSRVLIVGYADSTGSPTHNLGLSEGTLRNKNRCVFSRPCAPI